MTYYTGTITALSPQGIFVFGSNTQGRHGKGAALTARKLFGAVYGQARGRQGQSYAIVTKDLTKPYNEPSVSKEDIRKEIATLYDYARENPELNFFVAYSGNGVNLNNYSNEEMAEMFNQPPIPSNIIFEENFLNLINNI